MTTTTYLNLYEKKKEFHLYLIISKQTSVLFVAGSVK